jgi:integrase/recombinase XerD
VFNLNGNRKCVNGDERRAYRTASGTEEVELRRAFLITLFYTDCRISEEANLQVGRVDLSANAVIFESLKRRKRSCFRSMPVPPTLAVSLCGLIAGKNPAAKV